MVHMGGGEANSVDYWTLVEPHWEAVDIYSGPIAFQRTLASVPERSGHLLAAHWCQSEVCNGGFHQFFINPTGVLAPEALEAFRAMGRLDLAELLRAAMEFFGATYPRDQDSRCRELARRAGTSRADWDPFFTADDAFYDCLEKQPFEVSANSYAAGTDRG